MLWTPKEKCPAVPLLIFILLCPVLTNIWLWGGNDYILSSYFQLWNVSYLLDKGDMHRILFHVIVFCIQLPKNKWQQQKPAFLNDRNRKVRTCLGHKKKEHDMPRDSDFAKLIKNIKSVNSITSFLPRWGNKTNKIKLSEGKKNRTETFTLRGELTSGSSHLRSSKTEKFNGSLGKYTQHPFIKVRIHSRSKRLMPCTPLICELWEIKPFQSVIWSPRSLNGAGEGQEVVYSECLASLLRTFALTLKRLKMTVICLFFYNRKQRFLFPAAEQTVCLQVKDVSMYQRTLFCVSREVNHWAASGLLDSEQCVKHGQNETKV